MFEFLRRAFRPKELKGLEFFEQFKRFVESGSLGGQVKVSPKTAMRCPSVYSVIKILAESVAQIPVGLFRHTDDRGGKELAKDHPLYNLVTRKPNKWQSSYDYRLYKQSAVSLYGNAYSRISRNSEGRVIELTPLRSESVKTEVKDDNSLEFNYRTRRGESITYPPNEIFYLHGLGEDPLIGDSPVVLNATAIQTAILLERHAHNLMKRGARPGGVLEMDGTLSDEAFARLQEEFARAREGVENSGETLILEEGASWKAQQFSSVDMEFQNMRRFALGEVARVWRVPLHMVQDLERATHANAEALGRQFVTFALLPQIEMWENAMNIQLLSEEEQGEFFFEFKTQGLARADLAQRFAAYNIGILDGVFSANEVRSMEGLPRYDGGDEYRAPLNTAPVSTPQGEADEVTGREGAQGNVRVLKR
jgi:HK97 family phage portal protein